MCKLGVISQERLKIEVKLLLSANRKSYMLRRLAQQWMTMTLSDLDWPFHTLCTISVVAELLVLLVLLLHVVILTNNNPNAVDNLHNVTSGSSRSCRH